MTTLRTIHCDVKACEECHVEGKFNEGFPGWGEIQGLIDKDTGNTKAHLCPKHLTIAKKLLMGENTNG